MPIGDYCERPATTVRSDDSVRSAAQRMALAGVGSLIVVQDDQPTGIVTDRDLMLETLCKRMDPGALTVGDIARKPLISVNESAPVRDAIRLMRRHAVRRLPVVDDKGRLVGIVAGDDLVTLAVGELSSLAVAIGEQRPTSEAQRSEP